jgi:hypothetical protein
MDDPALTYSSFHNWISERSERERLNLTPEELVAMDLAMEADSHVLHYRLGQAERAAREALRSNRNCIDAHRVLACLISNEFSILGLRECLFLGRRLYPDILASPDGATNPKLHPYVRCLFELGMAGLRYGYLSDAVIAFEDILRIRRQTTTLVDHLILAYLAVIGCCRRGIDVGVVRTLAQLHDFLSGLSTHKQSARLLIWANILGLYAQHDNNWQFWARKVDKERVLPFLNGAARLHPFADMLRYWPDFVMDFRFLLSGAMNLDVCRMIHNEAKPREQRPYRTDAALCGFALADEVGEEEGDLEKIMFSASRFASANRPADRWYLNCPPSVLKKLIRTIHTSAERIALRQFLRAALIGCPQIADFYPILPVIAEYYHCDAIAGELNDIVEKSKKKLSKQQWIALSRRAVALVSLPVMAEASENCLDERTLGWAMKVGLEDMFGSPQLACSIIPHLPWIMPERELMIDAAF